MSPFQFVFSLRLKGSKKEKKPEIVPFVCQKDALVFLRKRK